MTSPENKQDDVYKIPPTILILAIINLNNCSLFYFGHKCLSIAQIPIPLAGVNINTFLSGATLY